MPASRRIQKPGKMSEPSRNHKSRPPSEEYNCYACARPDSADNMVKCDSCENWCHYSCAGVTSLIAEKDWVCSHCTQGKNVPYTKFSDTIPIPAVCFAITPNESTTRAGCITANNTTTLHQLSPYNTTASTAPAYQNVTSPAIIANVQSSALSESSPPTTANSAGTYSPLTSDVTTSFAPYVAQYASVLQFQTIPSAAPSTAMPIQSAAPLYGNERWAFPKSKENTLPLSSFTTIYSTSQVSSATNPYALGAIKKSLPVTTPLQSISTGTALTSTKVHNFDEAAAISHNRHTSKASMFSKNTRSSRGKYIQLELGRLEEEKELREKRDKEYLSKKYNLLSQLSEHSSDEEDWASSVASVKVNNWLESQATQQEQLVNAHNVLPTCTLGQVNDKTWLTTANQLQQPHCLSFQPATKHATAAQVQHQPLFATNVQPNLSSHTPKLLAETKSQTCLTATHPPFAVNQQHLNEIPQTFSSLLRNQTRPQVEETTTYRLSRSQIAARQLMSRDLQNFTGNAEEWPVFISNFIRSTNLCGFTEEENLLRLQKSLKGDALDAVRSILIQPQCVDQIIKALRTKFGRPQVIIQAVLQKIQTSPAPKEGDFESIVDFSLAVQNYCATIEASGLTIYLQHPSLLQELENKLPHDIRLNWATHKYMLSECTLVNFNEWLMRLAEAASCVVPPLTSLTLTKSKQNSRPTKGKGFVNAHLPVSVQDSSTPADLKCCICEGNCTSVEKCVQFLNLNRTLKWSAVREHHLCRRCLKKHSKNKCSSTAPCGINNCTFNHHKLLHSYEMKNHSNGNVSVHQESNEPDECYKSLFRVVPVTLHSENVKVKTFAFLDDGSSVTLLDEDIANQLQLKGKPEPLRLKWTGDTCRLENNSQVVQLQISGSQTGSEMYSLADVHTVKRLNLPKQSLDIATLQSRYEHLKGVNIESYTNALPRLLIGLNNTKLGLPLNCKEGGSQEPVAIETRLGWVVHGNCSSSLNTLRQSEENISFHMCECDNANLERLVNDFIVNDSFGTSCIGKDLMSSEDQRAINLLKTYTLRTKGRFETTLLWKYDDFQMPDSYPMAEKRLACLQRRMKREPELADALTKKIEEYVTKGYARRLSYRELQYKHARSWYLPIFPVFNPSKPGKMRIVWDAAATVKGVSLNSFLLKGPDQLTSLVSVIFKFREERIAICGDIMEMFHQVRIRKEDQPCQRFLWSRSSEEPPVVYAMMVMTFGASCSPCCAQYTKNRNADDFAERFPRAVRSIKQNHYVDDLMDSVATEEEAIKLAKQIRNIHQQGGFYIRNWISNSPAVLQALESGITENKNLNFDVELTTEKVLGMWWCTSKDCFTYKLTTNSQQREILFDGRRPTKREVLKILMTIFDPLGLLAHFLMFVKILLQEIWRSKIDWDIKIQEAEFEKWLKWVHLLPAVENLNIPRCYITSEMKTIIERQLHIFVDASENGFAAVAYIRSVNGDHIECALLGAKTRVAPLKNLSIPRLELQAALLGARLAKSVADSHSFSFSHRVFWSDSRNVLSWLRSDHRRYRQFVAFRVSEILDLSNVTEWRWVPTKVNVADEATKWKNIPVFSSKSRWFSGPEFLKSSPDDWPKEVCTEESTIEELKTYYMNIHSSSPESIFRIDHFSRWNPLLRSTAYIIRYMNNLLIKKEDKHKRTSGFLKQNEIQTAWNVLMREAQRTAYQEELADLTSKQLVEKSSPIFNLCPYLDEHNVLRANGRINLYKGSNDYFKALIILPRDHPITNLIMTDMHYRFHHQNHETAINELRQKFHIQRLRTAYRIVRKECQDCKNQSAKPREPIMAQLPKARLSPYTRPFTFTGVDYFGPINVSILRRTEKRWGVLLTCLTTRAVHIEIAHSLTADSCILALRNFVARRGTPVEIYSDNGTNFQGAERELREALRNVDKNKLMEAFTCPNTKWSFIPPSSPHMGGCWERLVRSIKSVLYKIMPMRSPSDELLKSMMLEVENIVNSRPLTYLPIDHENEEALTPNHFLVGSSNGLKPLAVFDDDVKVVRKNWQTSQLYADHFWKRWVSEYLPTLTRRSKWFAPVDPIKEGDIVLIVDHSSPRNCWLKGRVIQTRVADDGQVRSATVSTSSGVYIRPAVKLAVLDVTRPRKI